MDQGIQNNVSVIEFGGKFYPCGMMHATHKEKLDLLKYLIKELGPLYDKDQKSYYISDVTYEEGKLYFDCKEEVK
jgi:hypothetical protein